jgi:hypothetical protein
VNSWKVILATMVIFGAGVITGGLLVKNTTQTGSLPPPHFARTNQPAVNVTPPQMLRLEFLLRAHNELQLTPGQHDRIEKIIREGQERSRKLWEGVAPEMRKELQQVHERIRAELSPKQRAQFEQMLKTPPRQPGNPDNPQMPPDRMRDRLRQGGSDMLFNPNSPQRPFRRDNPPPPNSPGGTPQPSQPPQPAPPAPDNPPAQ